MKKECKTIVYDRELQLEAYRFEGLVQPFPNHFHEYYVIGYLEEGERQMKSRNQDYQISRGNIVVFHPGEPHACAQYHGGTTTYCQMNIPKETMLALCAEVSGKAELPGFTQSVIADSELLMCLSTLHGMIMAGSHEFEKEELLLTLISLLLQRYVKPFEQRVPECRTEIEAACDYIRMHYNKPMRLSEISGIAGLSKSALLRAFTRERGVTPYRYLETIRIHEAKQLLEQGCSPLEAAISTGFSDQSHFTNYFTQFIGLSPGLYRELFRKSPKIRKPQETENSGKGKEK